MRKLFILLGATVAFATFAPMSSNAQGISVEGPGVGVHVGERPYYREYRTYDEPVVRERRVYREREVGLRGGCKTVTIQRDDGSMKRIRRCDY
jgi:hypothetical protein